MSYSGDGLSLGIRRKASVRMNRLSRELSESGLPHIFGSETVETVTPIAKKHTQQELFQQER
jgi:hypothetical protein